MQKKVQEKTSKVALFGILPMLVLFFVNSNCLGQALQKVQAEEKNYRVA